MLRAQVMNQHRKMEDAGDIATSLLFRLMSARYSSTYFTLGGANRALAMEGAERLLVTLYFE
jgi:hypothetical protein